MKETCTSQASCQGSEIQSSVQARSIAHGMETQSSIATMDDERRERADSVAVSQLAMGQKRQESVSVFCQECSDCQHVGRLSDENLALISMEPVQKVVIASQTRIWHRKSYFDSSAHHDCRRRLLSPVMAMDQWRLIFSVSQLLDATFSGQKTYRGLTLGLKSPSGSRFKCF